jgi:hypothetical protein
VYAKVVVFFTTACLTQVSNKNTCIGLICEILVLIYSYACYVYSISILKYCYTWILCASVGIEAWVRIGILRGLLLYEALSSV